MKVRPDFLIIGSMKCGTTTLYNDIEQLKQVYLPSEKEPDILFKCTQAEEIRKEYCRHFSGCESGLITGEASTVYSKLPESKGVAERAKALCGEDLKIIMIMRDPIQRIYSHLRHDLGEKRIRLKDINQVVLRDKKYVNYSNYPMQLEPWIASFGKESILCIKFQDLNSDRASVLRSVARHIGVDFSFKTDNVDLQSVKNKSSERLRTNKVAKVVINSSMYRNLIRPRLSDRLRNELRKSLLPKANIPTFALEEKVELELRRRFENFDQIMDDLVGKYSTMEGGALATDSAQ